LKPAARRFAFRLGVWHALLLSSAFVTAQSPPTNAPTLNVNVRIQLPASSSAKGQAPAALVWLDPLDKTSDIHPVEPGHFTLLQKNRMFSKHLLVIPLGSVVSFPNADPFFHNVFSFFNGKRFDLGLYEAGASKEITFSREGVSYIFCNIHPEMSAVIITLDTPLYATTDASARASIRDVPPGEYVLHTWVEGLMQPALDRMTRRVHVEPGGSSFTVDATTAPRQPAQHLDKFGQPYDRQASPPY
jgi:plastocyanin